MGFVRLRWWWCSVRWWPSDRHVVVSNPRALNHGGQACSGAGRGLGLGLRSGAAAGAQGGEKKEPALALWWSPF